MQADPDAACFTCDPFGRLFPQTRRCSALPTAPDDDDAEMTAFWRELLQTAASFVRSVVSFSWQPYAVRRAGPERAQCERLTVYPPPFSGV